MGLFNRSKKNNSNSCTSNSNERWNYCPICGKQVQKEWNVCPYCGRRLSVIIAPAEETKPNKQAADIVSTSYKQNAQTAQKKSVDKPRADKTIGKSIDKRNTAAECEHFEISHERVLPKKELAASFELTSVSKNFLNKNSFFYRYKCLLNADGMMKLLATVKSKIKTIEPKEDADVGMYSYGGCYTYTQFLEFLKKYHMDIYGPDRTHIWFDDGTSMSIETLTPDEKAKITVTSSSTDFDIAEYFLKNREYTVDGMEIVGKKLVRVCPTGTVQSVTVPEGITEIAERAFCDPSGNSNTKYIREIVIPDSVERIGAYAFSHCENLTKVKMSDNIQWVGEDLFKMCVKLDEVIIGQNAPEKLKIMVNQVEEARARKKRQEEWQKLQAAKRKASNESELKNVAAEFSGSHGGDENSAARIAEYIILKLGQSRDNIFERGAWYIYADSLEYHYEGGAFRPIGDGGEEWSKDWSITFVNCTDRVIENEKLLNTLPYSDEDGTKEQFVCQNPFGLKGIYEISYCSKDEYFD